MKGLRLIATGGALPGRTVTNEELSRTVDTSLLTSLMSTPAPAAILFFLEGLRRSGFARSFGVMERMMASI